MGSRMSSDAGCHHLNAPDKLVLFGKQDMMFGSIFGIHTEDPCSSDVRLKLHRTQFAYLASRK
jgi:hypothetical protein